MKEVGGETGLGGFRAQTAETALRGNQAIREATTLKAKDAAQVALNTELNRLYANELIRVNAAIENAQTKQAAPIRKGTPGPNETRPLEFLEALRRQLEEERAEIGLRQTNTDLTGRKDSLEAARANALQEKPFDDRMKALGAEIDALKAKLAAIGQPEAAQILAKAFGEAQKAIAEVNKALEKHNVQLTDSQKNQIRAAEQTIASTEAEAAWQTKFNAATVAIADRIRNQELLTAAIGKGYEATRQANVEARLAQELGAHFNDPAWMANASNQADVAKLRQGFTREFDTQHAEQSAQAIYGLTQQIQLERELAAAQAAGAEAMRQVTLAAKLREMQSRLSAEQYQKEAAGAIALYNAERENASAAAVAKIEEKIEATDRLTAATLKGAEALRQARLQNELAAAAREDQTTVSGLIGVSPTELAIGRADVSEHAKQVAEAAAATNRIQQIDDQISKLTEAKETLGDTLPIEIALRDLENERLKAWAEMSLQMRSARDGVRAFFIEMQEDAKSAAAIIADAMNSTLDKASSNLAKLFTGQKTDWAKSFQQIGEQMTQSSIKSLMQKGLGELGKTFGVDMGGAKPDFTAGNPGHVKLVGGLPGGTLGLPGIPGRVTERIGDLDRTVAGAVPMPGAAEKTESPAGPGILGYLLHESGAESKAGTKLDGSSADLAVWVRMASSFGAPATSSSMADLIGRPEQIGDLDRTIATSPGAGPASAAAGENRGFSISPSFPGLGQIRIPGLNVDAGGFERGPAASDGSTFGSNGAFTRLLRLFLPGFPGIQSAPQLNLPLDRTIATSPDQAAGSPASTGSDFGEGFGQAAAGKWGSQLPSGGGAELPSDSQARMTEMPGIKAPPNPQPTVPHWFTIFDKIAQIGLNPLGAAMRAATSPGSFGPLPETNIATAPDSGGMADSGDFSDAFDFGGWMAEGGDVEPGKSYIWQEAGHEWFAPGTSGRIVPEKALGGSPQQIFNIDARGADLGAHNRIMRGVEASSKAAVVTAVQTNHERSLRTPQRTSQK